MKRKFYFKIKGDALVMDKFSGLEKKALSPEQEAEGRVYRTEEGKAYLPARCIRAALRDSFVAAIERGKGRLAERTRVWPRIIVEPSELIITPQEYDVWTRVVLIYSKGRVARTEYKSNPIFRDWTLEGYIVTTLKEPDHVIKERLEYAGRELGIGASRVLGYGRFKVVDFKRVQ